MKFPKLNTQSLMGRILLYILSLIGLVLVMKSLDYGGLLLFFYILFMPLGILSVFIITFYFFKHYGKIRGFIISSLATLGAISLVAYDIMAPRIWFENYCEANNAGLHIYETAENVSGFYVESEQTGCGIMCRDGLLFYGFDYVEAKLDMEKFKEYVQARIENEKENKMEAVKYSRFATEPGYYRFYIVPSEDDPRCEISNHYLDLFFKERTELGLGRAEEYLGICIATEKIEKPKSKYFVSFNLYQEENFGQLKSSHIKIGERSNGQIIAERKRFNYWPEMFFYAHQAITEFSCPKTSNQLRLNEVLFQKSENG